MYREYQPCGLLAPYVDKIWEFKGSPEYGMRINVLPDGCTDLIFALGGITQPVGNEGRIMPSCRSFFVGPMKRYSELVAYTETVHMVGIRFHPCGLFRFMDLPVQELGGQRISSADLGIKLFDDSFTERLYELPDLRSRIQCIETVLVRSMHKHDVVDKQIVFAVNHIHLYHGQREIRLLAEDTCLCQRHLERRFKLFTGFTPTSPVQASQTLITHILEAMDKELERPFTIALSGGTTPATLFEVWEREYATYTPWSRIYFYWVDERCVPPGDDQSNFGLAYRLLFSKVGIPASHYYRIVGEGAPEEEAKQYSSIVKTTVPTVDGVPVFDFVLLGIGEDGHTSSIFPDHQELLTAGEPYEVSVNPYNKTVRICMTGRPLIEAQIGRAHV